MDARSAALAKGLLAEGIGKGSRVGILIPNSADFLVAALGVARVGAVFVPVNTFSQTRELGWLLRHADVTAPHRAPDASSTTTTWSGSKPRCRASPASAPTHRCSSPDAPFLRAIHVWGASDRAWSRGDEAEIVAAGERAGIDDDVPRTRRGRAWCPPTRR